MSHHVANSCLVRMSSNELTTRINKTSGTSFHGASANESMPSSSRSRLPQDGIGSATPSPRMPRFASLRMKTGMEIQNWAYKIGFRFGKTWNTKRRTLRSPEARACKRKSELRIVVAPAQRILADAAQPNKPSRRNVANTDSTGETSSGRNPRTTINRNSRRRRRSERPEVSTEVPPLEPATGRYVFHKEHGRSGPGRYRPSQAGAYERERRWAIHEIAWRSQRAPVDLRTGRPSRR